jgi:hypothetical protein
MTTIGLFLLLVFVDTRAKSVREAFRPKLKKNAGLLINPNLDEAFYIRLKAVKSSSAAKANIDPIEKIYRNQTFKILDLVKPLWFLASRIKKKKKSRSDSKAMKTALKLWAVVYHDITNARHRNILAQIYPQNIGLLDDKAILPTGGEHLFGPKFTQALVEQVKTLNALEMAGGALVRPDVIMALANQVAVQASRLRLHLQVAVTQISTDLSMFQLFLPLTVLLGVT